MQRESFSERVSNRDDESRKYTIEGEIVTTNGTFENLNNGQVYSADGIQRAHFNVGASPLNINFSGGETLTDEELHNESPDTLKVLPYIQAVFLPWLLSWQFWFLRLAPTIMQKTAPLSLSELSSPATFSENIHAASYCSGISILAV